MSAASNDKLFDNVVKSETRQGVLATCMNLAAFKNEISKLALTEPQLSKFFADYLNNIIIPVVTSIDPALVPTEASLSEDDNAFKLMNAITQTFYAGIMLMNRGWNKHWEGVSGMAVEHGNAEKAVVYSFEQGLLPAHYYTFDIPDTVTEDVRNRLQAAKDAFAANDTEPNFELLEAAGIDIQVLLGQSSDVLADIELG